MASDLESLYQATRQILTRAETKAEADVLFNHSKDSRKKDRRQLEKLFVQTDGAETMAPNLQKEAKELTQAGRNKVKGSNFVFPDKKKYPIHDEQHARSALGFSKMHGSAEEQAAVRKAVAAKYPHLMNEKEKTSAAKNTALFFDKLASQGVLTEAQKRFPELLKAAMDTGPLPRPTPQSVPKAGSKDLKGATPTRSPLAGGDS